MLTTYEPKVGQVEVIEIPSTRFWLKGLETVNDYSCDFVHHRTPPKSLQPYDLAEVADY